MKKTVATILVEHLRKFGVKYSFGIPGKAVVPLILEMEKQEIPFLLARHESGAGFMAGGYAFTNKTLGVAIGTSGPGGTNLLTSAGQALAFHQPVLFITGHPSMKETGKAMGQDSSYFGTDLVKMFESVTLFSARVERAELFEMYFRHALEKALVGRKGPVHLSIPADILREEIEEFSLDLPYDHKHLSSEIDRAVNWIEQAKSPLLFVGKGAQISNGYEEIKDLSLKYNIPIVTTPGGKGSVRSDHPTYLGPFGLGGTDEATHYFQLGVDLLIVVGTKLTDMTLAGFTADFYPEKVIQFDIEPTFVGKSIPVPTLPIIGDAKENIKHILNRGTQSREITSFTHDYDTQIMEQSSGYISAVNAVKVLRNELPSDTMVFGDDGSHSFYAIRHFTILEEGTFLFDDVFGTMGNAIGYSIGAKLANPNQTVVCLSGDGCTLMHGTEISTAVCHSIPVIFVVFNNGRLDMVDKGMRYNIGRSVGTVYEAPVDIQLFARALGADSYKCRTQMEIKEAIAIGLQNSGPTVIEIMVDPEEIPPTMKRG